MATMGYETRLREHTTRCERAGPETIVSVALGKALTRKRIDSTRSTQRIEAA